MGLSFFEYSISDISLEETSRFDFNFLSFNFNVKNLDYYAFEEIFDIHSKNKLNTELIDGDFEYAEIGNVTKDGFVDPVKLNFDERAEIDEGYYKKIEKGDIISVEEGDILISKIRPNLRKFVYIDEFNKGYFYTSAFIRVRAKYANKLIYYALRTVFCKNLISISRQGKGYPTIKSDDLRYIKLNKSIIDKLASKELELTKKVEDLELKIRELNEKIVPEEEIINDMFRKEFNLNIEKLDNLKTIKDQYIDFSLFSNNIDLRCSSKFHRVSGDFAYKQLIGITDKKIKHFIDEPIILGKSISPSDYDDGGEYIYISMASIKKWRLDKEEANPVSDLYSSRNSEKTVKLGDIIIARSGEGTIGKVAIIDDENIKGIFSDFTMRIRLNNYNNLFAYYYFRSEIFQYLIEIHKKGLGNNTNIFPNQIQEFPMIDIPLGRQKKISDEIHSKIKEQNIIRDEIIKTKQKIECIVERAILE